VATVTFEQPRQAPSRRKGGRTASTRSAPRPRPGVLRAAEVVAGFGLGAVVALTVATESGAELALPGGIATFLGNLTGMVGMYLALLMVLLVSRIAVIERVMGQDGLLRWHRRLGPWPISLIGAHAVLTTIGYAEVGRTGAWAQVGTFVRSYPDMLAATVALGLMVLAGIVSIRAIRTRLRRETWWVIHLYLYLALALSFAHVIVLGQAFVGHPLTQIVWSAIWASTAGLVLGYRVGLPVYRSLRHRLKVVEVRREAPGVTSIICGGRRLDRLPISGGQFLLWRFLAPGLWWQAHPYSVSALPRPPHIRLTVKAVGDHSSALARIRPGTSVFIEGPYGAFTRHAQRRQKVVLLAAGIGITALRALLEDLPRRSAPIVIVRAPTEADLVLHSEVAELVRHRKGVLHELFGSRREARIDTESLRRLVPDLPQRDVYVCGPPAFVADVERTVRRLGVPDEAVHHEAFAY